MSIYHYSVFCYCSTYTYYSIYCKVIIVDSQVYLSLTWTDINITYFLFLLLYTLVTMKA